MSSFFFFNDTATTEIYTLSLHDALPIYSVHGLPRRHRRVRQAGGHAGRGGAEREGRRARPQARADHRGRSQSRDRKSTRLNSSHGYISYAVFCLKKKKNETKILKTPLES